MRLSVKGATESSISVHVESNMEISSSALRAQFTSNLQIGEVLKASENCEAVKGLIERRRRAGARNSTPAEGMEVVNRTGKWSEILLHRFHPQRQTVQTIILNLKCVLFRVLGQPLTE